MAKLIAQVTNGDPDSSPYAAVPLSIALPVFFVMLSALGTLATWNYSAVHERTMIADAMEIRTRAMVATHERSEELWREELSRRITVLEDRATLNEAHWSNVERQVNINTGIIEHRYPR